MMQKQKNLIPRYVGRKYTNFKLDVNLIAQV